MIPRVYNKSKAHPLNEELTVYVGRGSEFGNPFEIGVWDRNEVIEMHRIAIEYRIRHEPGYLAHIQEKLRGKHLLCFCKPYPCHADYLLELANGPTPT